MDDLRTEHLKSDLKGRSVRGGAVVVTSQGLQFLLQLVFTVVLARLLTPSDFGLVAMVTAVTGLGQAFADLGLSEATIQRPNISHDHVSALFWVNFAVGLGLSLLTAGLAPVLAWFYREPQLFAITLALSPTFLIGGLRVQPDALLKRQMRFKALAFRDVIGCLLGVLVAVLMGLEGAGYWSIVAFPLIVNFVQMVGSWLMVKWRPTRPRRVAGLGSIIAFGAHVAGSYLVGSLSGNTNNVLIGWYWSAGPLGLYSKASNLIMRPVNQLLIPTGGVAIPTLSRIQSEPERFVRYYLGAVNLITWVTAALFGLLFVAARPVIILILGNQWQAAAPVFQLLCIAALAQPLMQSTNWLLVSSGRADRLLRVTLTTSAVTIATVAFSLPLGIKGVALWSSIAQLAMLPWVLKWSYRGTNVTLKALGRALFYPISLPLVGVASAELAVRWIAPSGDLSSLLVMTLGFAAVYLMSPLIRPVRAEITSFQSLLRELWRPGQAAANMETKTPDIWSGTVSSARLFEVDRLE